MLTLLIFLWFLSGVLGSWMVVWSVGGNFPFLNLSMKDFFVWVMVPMGPINLFCGLVYLSVFGLPPRQPLARSTDK